MNRQNIDILFRNYISHFDELNNPEHDEKYKWNAIGHALKHWNLDDSDISGMIRMAFSQSDNLINNRIVQPISGMAALAQAEPTFVRDAFGHLLSEDGGDIDARQNRILSFVDNCNAQLEKHFPGKWKYAQDVRSAIAYLAMLRPAENYLFKSTPAHRFARYMEYGDDIGAGATFRLRSYYHMCDQLVEYAKNCPELLEADAQRKTWWKDPSLHVLAYDLIFCFDVYKLNEGMKEPPVKSKSSGTQQRAYRLEQAARIQAELDGLQDEIDELTANIAALPVYDFTGETMKTRAFGTVEILRHEGKRLHFHARGEEKTFSLPDCIARGFLMHDNAELVQQYKDEFAAQERIKGLENQQKLKMMELKRYQ